MILSVKKDDKIEEKVKEIAQKYGLSFVALFGSQATGKTHQKSDIDIAYLSEADLNLERESSLIFDLSAIFRNENIDLLNLKNAKPLLYYGVFKNCRVIFEKTPLIFQTLRAYAFKKYVETKPLYEERFKRLEAKIAYI
jgi:predicted nucleotidyltransferase